MLLNTINLGKVLIALAITIWFTSCSEELARDEKTLPPDGVGQTTVLQWDTDRLFRTVCDPFTGEGTPLEQNGLAVDLYYLSDEQPRYSRVGDYMTNGHHADADLFFSQVNVPTRPWSRGFETESGGLLVRPDQTVLHEYFALKFQSEIKLSTGNGSGRYQFAVLSDDGAIFSIDRGNGSENIVNNDGVHPSRFACASEGVEITDASRIAMTLDYYQGPRYHISVILLWRQIPEGLSASQEAAFLADSACGVSGNSTFFDFTQDPPIPTEVWQGILNRNWQVMSAENFALPATSPLEKNPCAEEWDIAGGECYTETISYTRRSTFTLYKGGVDTNKLRVFVNGQRLPNEGFSYDEVTHQVTLTSATVTSSEVKIDYCINSIAEHCVGIGCGGGFIGI